LYKHINLYIGLVMCFCSLGLFAQTGKEKPLYQLRVLVKDSITGQPLEDATVTLTRHKHSHLTDAKGITVFDTLRAGTYNIECSFIGYHPNEQTAVLPLDRSVVILLCPSTYHLHEAVVESKAETGISTYSIQANSVMSAEQIEKLRGQNLGELLKNVNGITTLNTGPGIAKPVLRGLHSNRLVTLNNGVKQEGQQWGAEHAPEIDPFTVNRAEVIKGAASVEYGPEAIGGAIRLTPREYRTNEGIGGELALQAFSNNRQGVVSGLLEGTHGNTQKGQYSWRTQGSLRKAGDSHAPDYVISNTGFEEINGSVAAAYKFKELSVEFFGSVFNTKIGIMRAAHIGSSTDLYRAIASDRPLIVKSFTYDIGKPYQQVWHETQGMRITYKFVTAGRLYFQLSRQLNSRQEYDLGVSWNPQSQTATRPAYDLTLKTTTIDAAFEHKKWRNITGKIGSSFMDQSNYTDGTQKPIIPNFVSTTAGIFLFEKWSRGRWIAEVGTRADQRKQTIYVRNSKQEIETQNRVYQSATLLAGGSYAISEHWKISSTLSSAWRPPGINELYSNGLHNGTATYEIGDSNLVPERSYNLDLNLKHQGEKWVIELSAFHNRIMDFIYQLPVQPPTITLRGTFPTFTFRQTDVVLQGAELSTSYMLHKNIVAGAALSYLHAQDISNDVPLIYMPANRGKLSLQYQRNRLWKAQQFFAEAIWNYVAEQTRVPANIDYLQSPAAYSLFDFNIGFAIPVKKQQIKVSTGAKNMLNVSYRDYLNRFRYFTDEPGRNFIVRLTIPFTLFTKS
jgi:iron complex outermembrane receptor protein